jgi:carbamoyltransferase
MSSIILGISAYYHDSAAAILVDGELVAAAHEEWFSRIEHDSSFPVNAIKYVLEEACIDVSDVNEVAFYDKPFLKFERILEIYHLFAPHGFRSFCQGIPVWVKEKFFIKQILSGELKKINIRGVRFFFPEHHLSHASSAFYPSPFEKAAILTIDGVGEWTTATISYGYKNKIKILRELTYPHSIGLLYSAFSYYCGFNANDGEYKLMTLAPFGNPYSGQTKEFIEKIKKEVVDIKEDGSILLNIDFFRFTANRKIVNEKKFIGLFGIPPREKNSDFTQAYVDLAFAIQVVLEEIILKLAKTAKKLTKSDALVIAGDIALNCKANGMLLRSKIFRNIWIQPASGDAGGSVGAALAVWHISENKKRKVVYNTDSMKGCLLGPEFSGRQIKLVLKRYGANYEYFRDIDSLIKVTARCIFEGRIIGWFQGKMEFGSRALGNRSILADARIARIQQKLNQKIKFREDFRPFAPAMLEDECKKFFETYELSPYMSFVHYLRQSKRYEIPDNYHEMPFFEKLYYPRSELPSVTHVDFSARVQTVSEKTNYKFWKLLKEFKNLTGYGILINTGFNLRDEPIVCTPEEAYKCFMKCDMDFLIMDNFFLDKKKQGFI